MKARALLQEGRVDEAIAALGVELRGDPTDIQRRTLLFELLCFAGEYDRAEKQLDILAGQGQQAAMGALVYRSAIHAERTRQRLFSEGDVPAAPPSAAVTGTLNGRPFSSIGDADPRIGGRLEAFVAGQYTLLPFAQLASVRMIAPRTLRDTLWPSAKVLAGPDFKDLELGEVIVPALAAGSSSAPDDAERLAPTPACYADEAGRQFPLGQKLLLIDGEEVPILEVRDLVFAAAGA